MVTSRQKTALAIVLGALVAIAPSFFGYLQARQEIREKYQQGRDEAVNGYETLVVSVKDLQKTALEQHDYVVKLEGQLVALTSILAQLSTATPGLRMGAASPLPKLEKPPTRPNLPAPPDFDVVRMKR
jgi:hypothetical protein